jgi:hypothetical protein
MPFMPRQVKPPARVAIAYKVPEAVAALLKHYAEFLESTEEYVIVETLRLAFRRDKEFHARLITTRPESPVLEHEAPERPADQPRPTSAVAAGRRDPRGEHRTS